MFATTKKLSLTLVVSLVLILALSPVSEATDFQAVRRGHGDLKRIIRKRSPIPQNEDGGLAGVGGNRVAESSSAASSASASAAASSTAFSVSSVPLTSASATSSAPSSVSSASSTSVSSSSSSSSAPPSSSSSSSSSTISSTSSTPSSTPTSTTAPPSTPTTTSEAPPTEEPGQVTSTVAGGPRTKTATAESVQTDEPNPNTRTGATSSKAKTAALTVLIVVASSVGAVVIIWTIFRKWKLARSSKFDQRLQPIDWQPTDQHDGIIPAHRRTNSDTSSFHSGHGGYGATSDHGHGGSNHGHGRLNPLPEHDFTAGSTNLAPVGGYADLARGPSLTRGPSPSPSMAELSRGPSLTRPTYDVGVPLHHQSPYGARY